MASFDSGPWRVGDRITSGYEILAVLGQGGMGIVYLLRDHDSKDVLAAKTYLGWSDALNQRFIQEALAWVELDVHPNVVRAYFAREIGGRPVVFMEYLPHGDLAAWMRKERATAKLDALLLLAIQFCDGMAHAFSRGVRVHRDIKPQNCLLDPFGNLKVSDLGLAKLHEIWEPSDRPPDPGAGDVAAGVTRTGGMAGTPQYMAPEQWEDAKRADVRSDVYSFGVMLFEMLTGDRPFRGGAADLRRLHQQGRPPRLTGFDPDLDLLVQTCLAKRPDGRFADFTQVRSALAAIYLRAGGKEAPDAPLVQEMEFGDRLNKAMSLGRLGHRDQEIAIYDQILGAADAADPELVAKVMLNKAATLDELDRYDEEIAIYRQVAERYGGATDTALLAQVARALYNEASVLEQRGKPAEALAAYDRVLTTFISADPRAFAEYVATAMVNKAGLLGRMGQSQEELTLYAKVIERFAASTDSRVNQQVARAEFNRANSLKELGQASEAIAGYQLLIERYAGSQDRAVWEPVAGALLNQAAELLDLGRNEESIATYDRLVGLYGDVLEPLLQARVAEALNGRGVALRHMDRLSDACVAFDGVFHRFLENNEPSVQRQTTLALYYLGDTLRLMNEPQQAKFTWDGLVANYGHAPQPELQEVVGRSLVQKAAMMTARGLPINAIVILNELVELYGSSDAPAVREHVGVGMYMKAEILFDRKVFDEALDCYQRAHSYGYDAARRIAECQALLGGQSAAQQPSQGHLSPDGAWWWNGTEWISTVSADGKWRWSGTEWRPR